MTEHDRPRFAAALKTLSAAYPHAPSFSQPQISVYWNALAEKSMDDVERGVERAIKTHPDFLPTPARLLILIDGTLDDRAELAWVRAKAAGFAGLGYHKPIDFGDQALHAAITALGGWRQLWHLGFRDVEGVDVAVARKEFVVLYRHFLMHGAPADTPRAVACSREVLSLPAVRVDEAMQRLAAPREAPMRALMPPTAEQLADNVHAVRELLATVASKTVIAPARRGRDLPSGPPSPEDLAELERKRERQLARLRETFGEEATRSDAAGEALAADVARQARAFNAALQPPTAGESAKNVRPLRPRAPRANKGSA